MANAGGIRAGKAYVEIGANSDALTRGLKAAAAKLRSWGTAIVAVGASLGGAGAALAAPLNYAMDVFRSAGGELARVSTITGVNVETLGAMGYAATQLGGDLDGLNTGLVKMSRFLGGAADGSVEANRRLQDLGLSFYQLSNSSQEQRFIKIGEAIGRLADPARRDQAAMEVFGRSGAQMMRMLTAGGERWNELMAEGRSRGFVMSAADVALAGELNRAWKRLKAGVEALWSRIGAALAPAMTRLLDQIVAVVEISIAWANENRALFQVLDKLSLVLAVGGAAVGALGTAMVAAGAGAAMLAPVVTALVGVIGFGFTAAGFAVGLFSGLFSLMGAIVTGGFGLMGTVGSIVMGGLTAAFAVCSFAVSALSAVFGFLVTVGTAVWGVLSLVWAVVSAGILAWLGGAGSAGILSAMLGAVGISSTGAMAGLLSMSAAEIITTAATWLLNTGITVLEFLTGAILIPLALAALGLVALGLAAVAAAVAVAALAAVFAAIAIVAFAAVVLVVAAAVAVVVYFWDSIVAAARAAWRWVVDATAEALGWIGDTGASVWAGMADAASAGLSSIGDDFMALAESVLDIWGGISDAISAGDWELAGQIAMAGLKVAWISGLNALKSLWMGLKDWVLDGVESMAAAAVRSVANAFQGMTTFAEEHPIIAAALGLDNIAEAQRGLANIASDLEGGATAHAAQRAEARRNAAAEGTAERDAAQRELDAALEAASAAAWAAEGQREADLRDAAGPNTQNGLGTRSDKGTHGTFSGAALAGLNLGGQADVQERTLTAAQAAADALDDIRGAMRRLNLGAG